MEESTRREKNAGTIAAELLKLLGVIAGLGLGPLLYSRTGWFWLAGILAGGVLLLLGAVLSLNEDRKLRRKRLELQRDRLLQETSTAELSVQVHREPRLSQELLFSNPRLAALRASLESGWISQRQFSLQAGQILNEAALAPDDSDDVLSIPASVIALGIFILLPAAVAALIVAYRINHPAEIASYFSSPALLLWMAIESYRLAMLNQEKPWDTPHKISALSGWVYILAGVTLWGYLGLFFGEVRLVWLFVVGASLAVTGAALRLVALFLARRSGRESTPEAQPVTSDLIPAASSRSPIREPQAASGEISLPDKPTQAAGGASGAVGASAGGESKSQAAGVSRRPASRARFEIYTGSDGKFYFRLRAGNGEIVLASQGYASLRGCQKGIRSVRANAGLPERYDRRTTQSGEPYFVLLAGNQQVIGRSESYSSQAARERGIKAVTAAAAAAGINELAGLDDAPGQGSNQVK